MKNVSSSVSSLLILFSVLLSQDCATLTRRRTQRIPVTSSPAGATVFINGVEQGVTPLEIRLARKEKGQVIRIESPGYNPVEIRPKRTVSPGWIVLDLLLGLACATPIWYVYAASHDYQDPGMGAGSVWLLSTAAFAGLFTAMDLVSKKGNDFEPNELIVTLTKADGPPRVYTILVDADDLQNVKWIRVRRD